MPSLNFDEDPAYRPRGQWHRAFSGAGAGFMIAVIVVLVFGAAYLILHHGKRAPIFESRADAGGPYNNAKPSPAIPFGAKAKLAPPPTVAPLPADSVPPVITETETPGTAPVMVKAKDTEGVFAAKHQKSFGRGCDGKLSLTRTGLDFACTSGSEAPLHFAAAEIKGPNGNGIELKTGEKYHFDLGRGKVDQQEIFKDWAYTHVPGAYVARH